MRAEASADRVEIEVSPELEARIRARAKATNTSAGALLDRMIVKTLVRAGDDRRQDRERHYPADPNFGKLSVREATRDKLKARADELGTSMCWLVDAIVTEALDELGWQVTPRK